MTDQTPDADEKTEAPSEKRRQDATRDGDILKSREFAIAVSMVCGVCTLGVTVDWFFASLQTSLAAGLTFSSTDMQQFELLPLVLKTLTPVCLPLVTVLAVTVLAALAGQMLLTGFSMNGGLLAPKMSRTNPWSGLKRMFGMQGVVELLKSILKVSLVFSAGLVPVWRHLHDIAMLSMMPHARGIVLAAQILSDVVMALCLALVTISLIDLPLRYFSLQKKLRMTRQEVKDEHKQSEGAPELKQRLRQRQREIFRRDVRKGVESAHVVLTNPTEFAIALRYDRLKDTEPKVVARGKGLAADVIRELAAEKGIVVLSYPLLARAIYFTSRHGQGVQPELFLAVATILAFVFSIDDDTSDTPPAVDVPADVRFDSHGKRIGPIPA